MRKTHWSPEEIRENFSTEQILEKLRGFGITITPEEFLEDVGKFNGGPQLAKRWWERYTITAEGFDEDFPWMSAIVLWERLAPDVVSNEDIDDWMQDGYYLLEKLKNLEACDLWLKVWENLKKRFSPEMKSVDDADEVFDGMQSVYNWCQDFEMELGNAGLEDSAYHGKRIAYCQEFCRFFPETDDSIIENMRRGEGEALFYLGRIEEGEKVFKDLVEQFPESAWAYIGWGDMYCNKHNKNAPLDYEKAETIYRKALKNNVDEVEEVIKRLKDLEEERGTKGFGGDNHASQKKQKKSKKK